MWPCSLLTQHSRRTDSVFSLHWLVYLLLVSLQDTEAYKGMVKEDMMRWQNSLRAHGSADWVIIVVESNDNKKKNKTNILPRSSIVDKIRSDFCNKQNDRWARPPTPDPSESAGGQRATLRLVSCLALAGVWYCPILWRTRRGLRNPGTLCCSSCEPSSSCPSPRTWAASKTTCAPCERSAHSRAGASVNTSWSRFGMLKMDWLSITCRLRV